MGWGGRGAVGREGEKVAGCVGGCGCDGGRRDRERERAKETH